MAEWLCLREPSVLGITTKVVASRRGAVVLAETPFYPGGGGQLADRGLVRTPSGELVVTGIEKSGDGTLWHLIEQVADALPEPGTEVEVAVDPEFRSTMRALHTALHVVNALVFQNFDGALVTGVQMAEDATARIDFDLPEADNDRLRALEGAIQEAMRMDYPVTASFIPLEQAQTERGTLRSRSVLPPVGPDGRIRIVEIVGLDRQACGGTHLFSTAQDGRRVRILKIENKGRHNRRVRIGLENA